MAAKKKTTGGANIDRRKVSAKKVPPATKTIPVYSQYTKNGPKVMTHRQVIPNTANAPIAITHINEGYFGGGRDVKTYPTKASKIKGVKKGSTTGKATKKK